MELYGSLLIYRPHRDGRLSWPGWLTHSGHLTHEVVTRQPQIRRRSGKVRQLQTDVLTTEPRHSVNRGDDPVKSSTENGRRTTQTLWTPRVPNGSRRPFLSTRRISQSRTRSPPLLNACGINSFRCWTCSNKQSPSSSSASFIA